VTTHDVLGRIASILHQGGAVPSLDFCDWHLPWAGCPAGWLWDSSSSRGGRERGLSLRQSMGLSGEVGVCHRKRETDIRWTLGSHSLQEKLVFLWDTFCAGHSQFHGSDKLTRVS